MKHPVLIQFFTALTLLTRLPSPRFDEPSAQAMGKATLFYPLVGLIIGILLVAITQLINPDKALLTAAIITILWAALTGGLHLDGLADSADAWLGGFGDTQKIDNILKDPTLGTAGVIAINSTLLLKVSALTLLIQHESYLAILIAPVLGRSYLLALFLTTPYVRKKGMASELITYIPKKLASISCIVVVIIAGMYSITALLASLLGIYLLRQMMLKYMQGCTGDTAGATVEVGEMLYLVGMAIVI